MIRKGKHNMCGTRLYDIWRDMRHRCNCPGMRNYKHYGGRGIKVCDEWNNDFMPFYEWAMANGYQDDLTIDRKDTNGNYEPSNCRWADKTIQNANRRSYGKCEYIGVMMCSNGSHYTAQVKNHGKIIFSYISRSKNECALMRNKFILENGLDYPLNDIKDEYEDIRPHKNEYLYRARDKETSEVFEAKSQVKLAEILHISTYFIWQCLAGRRNSKKFEFEKVKI